MGMTCSALTAGVMALGIALGKIERSRLRVLRMIGKMAAGGDAFADGVNNFNRTMNLGHQLATWFTSAFGSTQSRAITGCDFSTTVGVNQYIDSDGVARCQVIAQQVAARVESMIEKSGPPSPPSQSSRQHHRSAGRHRLISPTPLAMSWRYDDDRANAFGNELSAERT